MTKYFFLFSCLIIFSSYGQTDETTTKNYLKIVYEQCANADIIEVESTSDGYIEVEYFCEGRRYEVGIKNNKLLFKEYTLSREDVPMDKIQLKLEKLYHGWTFDEVSQVVTEDTTFLKVEILKEGIEQNLYFTNDGKWFKIKPMDITSTMDFSKIELNPTYQTAEYKFHQAKAVYDLPDLLKEISGLVLQNDSIVFCVQDEIGSVFEYNFNKQEITRSLRFTDLGDFEGIALNKKTLYILRSDGNLFVYDLNAKKKTYQTMLQINSLNMEGLCYNEGYLYIACKAPLVNHDESTRMVYRVQTSKLSKVEPYFEINVPELANFFSLNYPEIEINNFLFNPSEVAFHPTSKEMYILSADDRFIAIYRDKKLINVIPLSPDDYYKPEGLSFHENGDLLISSEGDKRGFINGTINLLQQK